MDIIVVWTVLIGLVLIAGLSNRIRNTVITWPMLYVLFGLAAGVLFSERIELTFTDPSVEVVATLTLALVLATDASRIKLERPLSNYALPSRLLVIGLPLTIALGAVVADALFGEVGIWEAAVLAVILAPTDASLGQSVVSNKLVPARIRQALNIESGLNDGIAMPFLILTLSVAISTEQLLGSGSFLLLVAREVVFGILAGLLIGFLGARYIQLGEKSGWMSGGFQKLCWLALIMVAYGTAVLVGGNGFIAAFVFGIVSGELMSVRAMKSLDDFAEVINGLLMLMTFILFGMVMVLPAFERLNPTVLIYAILSLTVVRMLPVAVSLLGTKLRAVSVLFMGWFGPRGIASILYVLTVFAAEDPEDIIGQETIYTVVMITIFMSVLAHGFTAAPLSNWYGKYIKGLDKEGAADSEMKPVPEMPTRVETAAPVAIVSEESSR
ncbi:MAG: sodium:proton antiporter [Chloroflexota bacterium]|nr:MAG: sodium:proton antiporter [Chloroflexota bacterium]